MLKYFCYLVIVMNKKKLDIIYEDKYIIAVNKPTKLLTVSTLKEKEKTLFHEVSLYVKKKHKSNKVFIVHRLDKDTSGIVIFAKDIDTKNILQDEWNKYAQERKYIALLKGKITPNKKELRNRLSETKTNLVYIDDDNKKAKVAITKYELIKYVGNNSLVDIEILTGKKNQIRVQLANYGYPVIGDYKYNKNKTFYNRLMLHASRITLIHPITKEVLTLDARLPKEFNM